MKEKEVSNIPKSLTRIAFELPYENDFNEKE